LDQERKPYLSIVGTLQYLAHTTRPDICNSVRNLARFSHNPGEAHYVAAKRIVRYVAGTQELGLVYKSRKRSGEPLQLTGYADASWGDCPDSARSTTGLIFFLAGGPIAFTSRTQKSVARSTMEAEYMALFEAAQVAQRLRELLQHLGVRIEHPTTLFEDNAACVITANGDGHTKGAKHIEIRYHFTRELVKKNIVQIEKVGTEVQLADGLTKNVPLARLEQLRAILLG
jgi:hypothetical protein